MLGTTTGVALIGSLFGVAGAGLTGKSAYLLKFLTGLSSKVVNRVSLFGRKSFFFISFRTLITVLYTHQCK